MRLTVLLCLLGWLTAGFGGTLLFPALASLVTHGVDTRLLSSLSGIYMVVGVALIIGSKPSHIQMGHRDGILMTVVAWVWLSILGAFPLYFSAALQPHLNGGEGISFIFALFESVSGMTTTGATVLSGLDNATAGFLLWRSMLQWLGGMGILVLAVAILPFLGIGGLQLYRSELPGVTKDKLQPRLYQTARNLWYVYIGLTALCSAGFMFVGMSPFDAVNHAMTTLSTGGFSTHDASFLYYESIGMDTVAMVFMLLGSLNFALHFRALRERSLTAYRTSIEIRTFLAIAAAASLVMMVKLLAAKDVPLPDYANELHYALFNTISIISTTGFSNADFSLWPGAATLALLLLMFVGGCSGSTSGGTKVLRVLLVLKQGGREMNRLLHPSGVHHIKMDGEVVSPNIIQGVWAFAGIYIITFCVSSLVVATLGVDIVTSFSAAGATLTNVGPGLAGVGPYAGYGHLSEPVLLVLCLTMLLGRLELFTVLLLFYPAFWRK